MREFERRLCAIWKLFTKLFVGKIYL